MTSIVDTFPYPFHLPEAQELHATLAAIYPTSKGAMYIAERAGMQPAMLNPDQPAFFLWRDILKDSATGTQTRQVVQMVRDLNATNSKRAFLDALLASTPAPPVENQPRAA